MCKHCGKYYKHCQSLFRHQKYECRKEPMFKCNLCSYRVHQKSNLERHIRSRHMTNIYESLSNNNFNQTF